MRKPLTLKIQGFILFSLPMQKGNLVTGLMEQE